MTWTEDEDNPAWLRDLTQYQLDQARAFELGIWPKETALRMRAISSTITTSLVAYFVDMLSRKSLSGELDVFPPLSSADMAELSRVVMSSILAGSWLQSTRALFYLDDHPRKGH